MPILKTLVASEAADVFMDRYYFKHLRLIDHYNESRGHPSNREHYG